MKEKGYYYSKYEYNTKYPFIKNKKCKIKNTLLKGMDQVIFLQFLIEKTKNNKKERQMVYHELISLNYYQSFYECISHHFNIVYILFDYLIKSRFLSKKQKIRILFLKNQLKMKDKNTFSIS